MSFWSKTSAVALSASLLGFGATAVQAKNNKDQSCRPPQTCPAPVLQKPAPIQQSCCQMPVVQKRCAPVQTGCCPVDPKQVSKAEKAALHAQHEAAEACQRQQKAIAKAQHELDEEYAKEQSRIDKANAHLNHEVSELQTAVAKYDSFFGGPSEAVAEATPQPQPAPQPEITLSKPEPAPIAEPAPTQPEIVTEERVAVLETPAAPATAPAPVETPKRLPRTASTLPLIALTGLLSMSGYVTRRFRR